MSNLNISKEYDRSHINDFMHKSTRYSEIPTEESELLNALYKVNERFGWIHDLTVNAAIKLIRQHKGIYKCPCCHGAGKIDNSEAVLNAKYSGSWHLPPDYIKCNLCDGKGYTEEEYIPNIVQQGWKVK